MNGWKRRNRYFVSKLTAIRALVQLRLDIERKTFASLAKLIRCGFQRAFKIFSDAMKKKVENSLLALKTRAPFVPDSKCETELGPIFEKDKRESSMTK